MIETDAILDALQAAAAVATFIGFPLGVYTLYAMSRREARDAQYQTYDVLDNKYCRFLELCMQNLDLGVYGADLAFDSSRLSPEQKTRREILLLQLISILERAYLMMFREHSIPMRSQWHGWKEYMEDYSVSPAFARDWADLGRQFELGFQAFMNQLIARNFPDCVTRPGPIRGAP